MRTPLRWALLATLVLTAVALTWSPPRVQPPVAAVPRSGAAAATDSTGRPTAVLRTAVRSGSTDPVVPLPASLPKWRIEPARGDPFALPAKPEQQPLGTPPKTTSSPPTAQPPPPLQKPPTATPRGAQAARIRVLGTMRTPAGERLVLLGIGDAAVAAKVGMALDGGYTVEAVEPRAVQLAHAASGTSLTLNIPVSPNEP